eukprot:gene14823-19915_t
MKIKVKVIFESYERVFDISCGAGDKTFKWLGIAASQQFSNAAPNGALRRRDDVCGITEKTQYHPTEIVMSNGDLPHPMEILSDYLHDGDDVLIILRSNQPIDEITGSPSTSKYITLAYTGSAKNLNNDNSSLGSRSLADSEDDLDDDHTAQSREMLNISKHVKDTPANIKSKAEFMRIMLQSQMLNTKLIINQVNIEWSKVDKLIPKLKPEDSSQIMDVYINYWDVLVELFQHFAPDGYMSKENFQTFVEEADIFSIIISPVQSAKIYTRVCKYLDIQSSSGFKLHCVLGALILSAQIKYNDTLNPLAMNKPSYVALSDLFMINFLPLAKQLDLRSVLKSEFVTDDFLSKLRVHYDTLHIYFDKFAAKFREVPSTIPVEEITEMLYVSGLIDDRSNTKLVRSLLEDTKKGTIFGRQAEEPPSFLKYEQEEKNNNFDDDNGNELYEFSFPEFVEAIARAGYYRNFKPYRINSSNANNNQEDFTTPLPIISVADAMLKGVVNVVDLANGTKNSQHNYAKHAKTPQRKGKK